VLFKASRVPKEEAASFHPLSSLKRELRWDLAPITRLLCGVHVSISSYTKSRLHFLFLYLDRGLRDVQIETRVIFPKK
jgi:hypothetical protein